MIPMLWIYALVKYYPQGLLIEFESNPKLYPLWDMDLMLKIWAWLALPKEPYNQKWNKN